MAVRLIFVRHGLSTFNKKGLIQGRTNDSLLAEEGYQQAKLVGKALIEINFDEIYSSPLIRAAETAKTIEKILPKKYEINFDKNLLEVDLNSWSGLTINEIKTNYPNEYKTWKNDPENLLIKRNDKSSYKPIQNLFKQSNDFINVILNKYAQSEDANILIVAHNAILRCLILSLINQPKNSFKRIRLENASLSIINLTNNNDSFNTQIECLNQTFHLGKKLPTKIGDSRIFLVRHGETNWNREGRFQGQMDIPLNENGRMQADKASYFLKEVDFNKAYSSSMTRPFETAKIILKLKPNLNIEKIDDLVEISHGLWEGKLEKEIKKDWPKLLSDWHEKPEFVLMPEGESIEQGSRRSISAWNYISESQEVNDITLVVAHDAVNKTLICNILGLNFSDIWKIKQGNGGITVIDLFKGPNKDYVISSLNITSHLGNIIDNTASGAL